jgi:hypothetical protein
VKLPSTAVAVTVNGKFPDTVGVPLITPDVESNRPSGSDPDDTKNLIGGSPPIAVIVLVYASPTHKQFVNEVRHNLLNATC